MDEQQQVRRDKLEKIRATGKNAYPNHYRPKDLAVHLRTAHTEKTKEILEGERPAASIAGRVMAIRSFGKAAFVQVKDRTGTFQCYVQKDSVGPDGFGVLETLDMGDIVYTEGHLFKTKTNELSLHSEKFELVVKGLHPLADKHHGLTDVEAKYRQRYLDLIVSDETRDTFRKRSKIVDIIRDFLRAREFMEVETPMMHPIAGGASARPFVTHHNTLDMKLFLRIAPELYLKRLVVGGFERVFEINRNFRNEGISIRHNPEFTMLEFYQAYANYEDLMDLTEEMFQEIATQLYGKTEIDYQGTPIQLAGKWKRVSVENAILEYSDFKEKHRLRDKDALLAYGKTKKFPMNPKDPVGALQMVIFDEEVEKQLIQPTFVIQYPTDVSPLSRGSDTDPFVVDRFELFVYGREMANAFSELNDPDDQRERFMEQVRKKAAGDEEASDMDEDYVRALEYGMPPTAGQGIGIDRLVMLFTNSPSIRDVILFPQLRKSEHASHGNAMSEEVIAAAEENKV